MSRHPDHTNTVDGNLRRAEKSPTKKWARQRVEQLLEQASARAADQVDAAAGGEELAQIVAAYETAVATLPASPVGNPLAERVGPCWTLEGAAVRMSSRSGGPLTPEALRVRAIRRTLVGVQTEDRRWFLPGWQFDVDRERLVPNAAVTELWQLLPHDAASPWTHAAWMVSRHRRLDRCTPVDWVRDHGVDEAARVAAGARAAQLVA